MLVQFSSVCCSLLVANMCAFLLKQQNKCISVEWLASPRIKLLHTLICRNYTQTHGKTALALFFSWFDSWCQSIAFFTSSVHWARNFFCCCCCSWFFICEIGCCFMSLIISCIFVQIHLCYDCIFHQIHLYTHRNPYVCNCHHFSVSCC